MATKIKLEVNHGKHVKQQTSGQKITIPNEKNNQQNKKKQEIKSPKTNVNKQQEKGNEKNKNQQKKKQDPKNDKTKKQDPKNKAKQNEKISPKKQQKSSVIQKKQQKSPVIQKKQQKSSLIQKKPDKELQTLQRIKHTQQKTKFTIQELIVQYKNSADDLFTNHGHNEQKQRIINRKLQRLQRQKSQRHKKLAELQQRSLNRSMQQQKRQKEKQDRQQQRRKQKRKKKAQKKLQVLRALSQQRLQRQQKFQEYYNNEYKNKVFGFQKIQQEYKQKQKQYQQQIKQKLAKNKQKYLPMDRQKYLDFVDEYESNRWDLIDQGQRRRQFNNQLIQKQNKQMQAKLWKGQCHKRVLQQLKQKQKVKNSARTKLQKTREYSTIVKDQFQPKVNLQKRNNSLHLQSAFGSLFQQKKQIIDGKQVKVVARQKYQNGVNQGLVVENLRVSLDHQSKVKKGNQYLQFLKSLPKITKDESKVQQKVEQNPQKAERKKTPSTTFKPKIIKNPYYQSSQTDRVTSKSVALDQKRLKDPQIYHYVMADMRARNRQMQLQQKAIRHGRYNGILELQDKHNNLNRKLILGISEKLQLLSKM